MYKILREAFESVLIERELLRKTAKLVQKHTESSEIDDAFDIYEINNETFDKLEKSNIPDNKKVFNLIKSVHDYTDLNSGGHPYLILIGEKAERIAEFYKARQIETQETLGELKKLIDEINAARKEEEEKKMEKISEQCLYWRENEKHEHEVKKNLIKILINSRIDKTKLISVTNKIINVLKGNKE